MSFIDRVLHMPSYQWEDDNGNLVAPSKIVLFKEAFTRVNVFKSRKNWLPLLSWSITILIMPAFVFLLLNYATWSLFVFGLIYAMLIMSTQATIWQHRYCTHKSYRFKHPFWRILTQNLVIKTVPEEIYVISHHVHHVKSDLPGDPYNSHGGLLYCMLADVNHQSIAKDLNESDYSKAAQYLKNTGVKLNSYSQYQKFGSVSAPLAHFAYLLFKLVFLVHHILPHRNFNWRK